MRRLWVWHVSAPGAYVYIDVACNYAEDEGRRLGAGLQEQASNPLKLHWSRALLVSVKEKSGQRILAGKDRETSASEPLMRYRNNCDGVETGGLA